MDLKFKVSDRVVTGAFLLRTAPSRKSAPKKEPTASHKGFRVVGHHPGQLENAHAGNLADWAAWNKQTPEQRISALREKRRPPAMWDETQWRLRTKKTAVRTKPYDLASAAEECAELARKAGWIDVEVLELKSGESSAAVMFG